MIASGRFALTTSAIDQFLTELRPPAQNRFADISGGSAVVQMKFRIAPTRPRRNKGSGRLAIALIPLSTRLKGLLRFGCGAAPVMERERQHVDRRTAPAARTRGPALSKRSERRRVGAHRSDDPAGQAGRSAAQDRHACGRQCPVLPLAHGRLRTGCQWRQLPREFLPKTTVYDYFAAWRRGGLWSSSLRELVMIERERSGKAASPSAVIFDSQSVKAGQRGALDAKHQARMPARRPRASSAMPQPTPTA